MRASISRVKSASLLSIVSAFKIFSFARVVAARWQTLLE